MTYSLEDLKKKLDLLEVKSPITNYFLCVGEGDTFSKSVHADHNFMINIVTNIISTQMILIEHDNKKEDAHSLFDIYYTFLNQQFEKYFPDERNPYINIGE